MSILHVFIVWEVRSYPVPNEVQENAFTSLYRSGCMGESSQILKRGPVGTPLGVLMEISTEVLLGIFS